MYGTLTPPFEKCGRQDNNRVRISPCYSSVSTNAGTVTDSSGGPATECDGHSKSESHVTVYPSPETSSHLGMMQDMHRYELAGECH